jgi:hypothetical protein
MASEPKFYTQGDGTIMPRTGVWVDPGTGRWGVIRPLSAEARRIQELYDAQLMCDHLWVAGGLVSDWICEHCGKRRGME